MRAAAVGGEAYTAALDALHPAPGGPAAGDEGRDAVRRQSTAFLSKTARRTSFMLNANTIEEGVGTGALGLGAGLLGGLGEAAAGVGLLSWARQAEFKDAVRDGIEAEELGYEEDEVFVLVEEAARDIWEAERKEAESLHPMCAAHPLLPLLCLCKNFAVQGLRNVQGLRLRNEDSLCGWLSVRVVWQDAAVGPGAGGSLHPGRGCGALGGVQAR